MRSRRAGTGVLFLAFTVMLGAGWLLRRGADMDSERKNPASEAATLSESQYTNRLIHEKSPYLLLHAHNPVDWYPWGEEAFEKARREQKPILLSIGYYTCHWCHVMEQESFADPALAEILNRYFVSIKVDREERPDVDGIYMAFVQATTGSGGWPLNVFLTPDLKPFFGGTYWPPKDSHGRPGFRTILMRVAQAWENDRPSILQAGDRATGALQGLGEAPVAAMGELSPALLDRVYQHIRATYDERYGGFGGAPKFPRPVVFDFLLRTYARTGNRDALEMTLRTLRAMAQGGIHDQLGGGFHRYSTDARWFLPHFEKMLYDQAQLAVAYNEAYQITRDSSYADSARDILGFVLREMRAPEGGFYSAQDADSLIEPGKPQHGEGAFYVWTQAEIEKVLGRETAAVFNYAYGVGTSGNVSQEQDFRDEFRGRNVLFEKHTGAQTAQHFGRSEEAVEKLLAEARRRLFHAREKRPPPPIDDKVVTAWNGLMISALSRAAVTLDEPRYLQAAQGAAQFVETRLYDPQTGKLRRRYRAGDSAIDGFLDDYAFLIQGLLDLYESSFESHWLIWAVRLQEEQDKLFWDSQRGGYYATTGDDSSILFRTREDYDGAEPSPNSVAALNLLRLAEMTDRKIWREGAAKALAAFGPRLAEVPEAMPQMAAALDFSLSKPFEIIIAGDPGASDTRELRRLVDQRYLPNKVLLLADGAAGQKQLAAWLPLLSSVARKEGKATAYVCENYACKLPTSDPKTLAHLLDSKP